MWNDHSPRRIWSAGSLSALPKAGAAKVVRIGPLLTAAIGKVENAAKRRNEAIAAADSLYFLGLRKGQYI
jgi:hypothetical protein